MAAANPTTMNPIFHLNAVQMKWQDAQQLAELRGPGWRLPTRAEASKHAAAILATNENFGPKTQARFWTSENGRNNGANAWLLDLKTGRQIYETKTRRAHVVLIRNRAGGTW